MTSFWYEAVNKNDEGVKRTRIQAVCTPPQHLCRPTGRHKRCPTVLRETPQRDPQSLPPLRLIAVGDHYLRSDEERVGMTPSFQEKLDFDWNKYQRCVDGNLTDPLVVRTPASLHFHGCSHR